MKIELLNTECINNTLKFKYYLNNNIKTLILKYSEDISLINVPLSILNIVFVLMIIPSSVYNNIELYVDTLDLIFYKNFRLIVNSFKNVCLEYDPTIELYANNKILDINNNEKKYDAITLFSCGIDAYFTVLKHYNESQLLLHIIGCDYSWEEYKNGYMPQLLKNTSDNLKLNIIKCRSNFKSSVLPNGSYNDGLYINHALRILSHAVPLAWIYKTSYIYLSADGSIILKPYSNKINESSYYRRPTACNPFNVNTIEFNGTNVQLVGWEYSKMDEISYIIDKCKNILHVNDPIFHVCWDIKDGKNCCKCEKCCRVIYQFLELGLDPKKYGFENYDINLINEFKKPIHWFH